MLPGFKRDLVMITIINTLPIAMTYIIWKNNLQ